MSIPSPIILDISEHQTPSSINYDKLAKAIDAVIIRVQYGSNYTDIHYKTHFAEFQKRGVPTAAYAWVRGVSNSDMEVEATDFYNRVKAYKPTFYWLDVEEQSMSNMRSGCEAFRVKLKNLSGAKVGVYVANHLYSQFNLDTSKFDGVWIPTYGSNNGQYNGSNPTATSNYNLHQYTSEGRLNGYNGPLDLSRLANGSLSTFFGGGTTVSKPEEKNYYQSGNYFEALQDLKTYNKAYNKVDKTWFFKKGSKFAVRDIVKMYNGATHAQVAGLSDTYVTLHKNYVKPQ